MHKEIQEMGGKFYPTGGKFSAEYFIWRERDLFPGGIFFWGEDGRYPELLQRYICSAVQRGYCALLDLEQNYYNATLYRQCSEDAIINENVTNTSTSTRYNFLSMLKFCQHFVIDILH